MAKTTKDQALAHWRALPTDGPSPIKHMGILPYKAEGSKFGACGIRIDGSPEFIDSVLSRLKDLELGENGITRLDFSRRDVEPTTINGERKAFHNAAKQSQVCYIRLCERGPESMHVLGERTKRFIETNDQARREFGGALRK